LISLRFGSVELPLGAQTATAAFDGTFALCAAPAPAEIVYQCPVQPISAGQRIIGSL
jgi:hypothetical protein